MFCRKNFHAINAQTVDHKGRMTFSMEVYSAGQLTVTEFELNYLQGCNKSTTKFKEKKRGRKPI